MLGQARLVSRTEMKIRTPLYYSMTMEEEEEAKQVAERNCRINELGGRALVSDHIHKATIN
jgi:hypothetical protein